MDTNTTPQPGSHDDRAARHAGGADIGSAPRAAGLSPGSVLCERFEILRAMDSDGGGAYFLARDLDGIEAPVLVHLLPLDATRAAGAVADRLYDAFGRALLLEHPSIVPVHGLFQDRDAWFVTMDAVDARPLAPSPRSLTVQAAGEVLNDVGRAVIYAHRNGVYHGNLSPETVMVTANGACRVTGFAYLASAFALPAPAAAR